MTKDVAVILVNGAVATALIAAAAFGKLPWPEAFAGLALLGIPSGAGAVASMIAKKDGAP